MKGKIPYNEHAMLCAIRDMKDFENDKRREEAVAVFNDIRDFFETKSNMMYLTTVLSKENLLKVLDEIQMIFEETEDYERCHYILEWRKQLSDKQENE
jgi:KaiC/GvpD/RAD55 family RecA-like ATPase